MLSLTEHLFTRDIDLFDGAVVELVELALQIRYDICWTMLSIDPRQLLLVIARDNGLDVRIVRAEELLEDRELSLSNLV